MYPNTNVANLAVAQSATPEKVAEFTGHVADLAARNTSALIQAKIKSGQLVVDLAEAAKTAKTAQQIVLKVAKGYAVEVIKETRNDLVREGLGHLAPNEKTADFYVHMIFDVILPALSGDVFGIATQALKSGVPQQVLEDLGAEWSDDIESILKWKYGVGDEALAELVEAAKGQYGGAARKQMEGHIRDLIDQQAKTTANGKTLVDESDLPSLNKAAGGDGGGASGAGMADPASGGASGATGGSGGGSASSDGGSTRPETPAAASGVNGASEGASGGQTETDTTTSSQSDSSGDGGGGDADTPQEPAVSDAASGAAPSGSGQSSGGDSKSVTPEWVVLTEESTRTDEWGETQTTPTTWFNTKTHETKQQAENPGGTSAPKTPVTAKSSDSDSEDKKPDDTNSGYTPGDTDTQGSLADVDLDAWADEQRDTLILKSDFGDGPSAASVLDQLNQGAQMTWDTVARPTGADDEDGGNAGDVIGEILDKAEDLWRGDPVPQPVDPDNPFGQQGEDAFIWG